MRRSLVNIPLEAYPYVSSLGYNNKNYLVCTVSLPLSKFLKRIYGAVRAISKFHRQLDEYKPFYMFEFSGAPKLFNFGRVDEYLIQNHVHVTQELTNYISIAQYGRLGQYCPPEIERPYSFEFIREWISQLGPEKDQFRNPYNQQTLIVCEGIYQAVYGFVSVSFSRIPSRVERFMNNKLPHLIYTDPYEALSLTKDFAHFCDRKFFEINATLGESPFRVFLPFMNDKIYAWGRYIQRSLPHGKPPTIEEYVERVSVEEIPKDEYLLDMRYYLKDKNLSGPFRKPCFRPTNKGSLETTRKTGGQSSFYDILIKYELIRLRCLDRKEWTVCDQFVYKSPVARALVRGSPIRCLWNDCFPIRCQRHSWSNDPEMPMVSSDWSTCHARFILLVAACWNMIKLFPRNPIQILILKERGGKYRIPTKSLVPVQVLGGVMRSRVNEILERDSRIRASLTNEDYIIIRSKVDHLIRSQDLSFATDKYSYQLMRCFYITLVEEGVFKDIPFALDYIMWIYPLDGRDIVIPRQKPVHFDFKMEFRFTVVDKYWLKLYESKPLYKNSLPGVLLPQAMEYRSVFSDKYSDNEKRFYLSHIQKFEREYLNFTIVNFRVVGVQKRGPCMGEPLSWPILPIVSCYGFDRTHPPNYPLVTCGDDSAFRTTRDRNESYNRYIENLGATISVNKDSIHPSRYIFTERLYEDGEAVGVMPFAPAFALPSLKQEQTYYTVGPSLNSLAAIHKTSRIDLMRILRTTRFRDEIRLYNENCIPSCLPHELGGLSTTLDGLPINWETVGKVANYIKSLDSECLLRGNRLTWSRKLLQPTRINEFVAKDLLRFVKNEEEPSKWTFNKAWLLKTQNIYALGSMTGSMPSDNGTKRPLIFNRKYSIKEILSKVRPSGYSRVSINSVLEMSKKKFNPFLDGFEPSFDDSTPVGVITDYESLVNTREFEILFSDTFERSIKRLTT